MFRVPAETVKLLYRAQTPHLRGRLRLDISSTRLPNDFGRPLDLASARNAVGERVVHVLKGCSTDSALVADNPVALPSTAVPGPPDSDHRLLVMPDPSRFETFVEQRLDEAFGLDPKKYEGSHCLALSHLAGVFFEWARTDKARQPYGFQVDGQRVTSNARLSSPRLTCLMLIPAIKRVRISPIDVRDFSKQRVVRCPFTVSCTRRIFMSTAHRSWRAAGPIPGSRS